MDRLLISCCLLVFSYSIINNVSSAAVEDLMKNKLQTESKQIQDTLSKEELGEDVHDKFGPQHETEMELCSSTHKVVFPNKALSTEGVFEFMVNDEQHKQGIRVETCTNPGAECNLIAEHLPMGYRSKCVQKYITQWLVVLNTNSSSGGEGFVTKPFEFPSSCSCVLVSNNNFGASMDTTPVNVTARATVKGESKTVN